MRPHTPTDPTRGESLGESIVVVVCLKAYIHTTRSLRSLLPPVWRAFAVNESIQPSQTHRVESHA